MLVVACSGFPIAVSRYLSEFRAVEIADTEIGIPGMGSIRRWQREAPEVFRSACSLRPRSRDGLRADRRGRSGAQGDPLLREEARRDGDRVPGPGRGPFSRPLAARAKKMLTNLPAGAPAAVVDAPHWPERELVKLCESADAVAATDPTKASRAPSGKLAYLALPGPAGHRSRYDEDTLANVADLCRRSTAETTMCVFRNIDMEANAKSLVELAGASPKKR